ncbi:kinase-like domain-containing protein [Amylostereum chailletii]|nr:kinase-like domain-containing protein [Amylostereum chailletii]
MDEDYLDYCIAIRTHPAVQKPLSPAALAAKYERVMSTGPDDMKRMSAQVKTLLNLEALKDAGSKLLGKKASGIYHIAQGGFNQVFVITFEDDSDVIARVNCSYAGQDDELPPDNVAHRIESEYATVITVRRRTSIPVAKMLSVVTSTSNPVRAPYSIQSRIIGRPLHEVWPSPTKPVTSKLSADQMEVLVQQVARIEGELMATTFDAIGSLIRDGKSGDIRVGRLGPSREHLYPMAAHDIGPWTTSRAFIQASLRRQLSRLQSRPQAWIKQRMSGNLADSEEQAREDLDYFTQWYAALDKAMDKLDLSEFDPPRFPFVLVHDDLEMGNILVADEDPSRVVGIVDWEGARVVPLWASHFANWFLGEGMYVGEEPDLLQRLLDVREGIHVSMQPAMEGISASTDGLRALWYIADQTSAYHSAPNALGALEHFLRSRPKEDTQRFEDAVRMGYAYVHGKLE